MVLSGMEVVAVVAVVMVVQGESMRLEAVV